MGIIFLNGEYSESENAKVSILDQGLLRGDGLFETIRARKGRIPFLADHLERIFRSAHLAKITIPYRKEEMSEIAANLLRKNSLQEAKLRLVVTRGAGQEMDPAEPLSLRPTVFCLVEPMPSHLNENFFAQGVAVVTVPVFIHNGLFPISIKSTSYFHNMAAKRYAREHGAFEAILTDRDGFCLEGATSNLFWVREKKVFTPPLGVEALPGITRKHMVEVLKRCDQKLCEEKIRQEELPRCEEVFMTSSVVGVLPVVKVNGQTLAKSVGPMTQLLRKAFEDYVAQLV